MNLNNLAKVKKKLMCQFIILIFCISGIFVKSINEDFFDMHDAAKSSNLIIFESGNTILDDQACTLEMLGNRESMAIRTASSLITNDQRNAKLYFDFLNQSLRILDLRSVNDPYLENVYFCNMPSKEQIVAHEHKSDGKKPN